MSMNEFRRLAAKIDQHMQQLSAQGVNDPHAIINRMIGYVPDLHKIWVRTSDDQLETNNCSPAPSDLSEIPMVLPPPGRDRSAETTEPQETDRLRESSSTIPFEREATSIPATAAMAQLAAVTRQ